MPLIRSIEPDLRSLIAYIVGRSRERSITMNRTKLVKLLYLVDVEQIRTRRPAATGLEWVFFHYGPYAFELIETLEAMERSELDAQKFKNGSVLYRDAPDAPDGDDWLGGTRRTVDNVIDRFAALALNELLDYVYFRTGPMIGAVRGHALDMTRARDDPAQRPAVALRAPAAPADIDERLARWRARTAQRLAPLVLDPPGSFLDSPADDLGGEGVRGVLAVPDASEL